MKVNCPKCGHNNDRDDIFCMDCGTKLEQAETEQAQASEPTPAESSVKEPSPWFAVIRAHAKPLKKGVYLAAYIAIGMFFSFFVERYRAARNVEDADQMLVYLLLAGASLVVLWGVFTWMTYRLWQAVQDGHARTTPAKAALLQLVPGFNILWIFTSFQGFAEDYNKLLKRRGLQLEPINEGFFLIMCIAIVASTGTITGFLAGVSSFDYTYVIYTALALVVISSNRAIDGVNGLLGRLGMASDPEDS